jgi:hypothetical protein
MGIYIIGSMTRKSTQQNNKNDSYIQPEIVTTAYVDNYDYYNFMPRRLFRNFYESDYDYRERERPVVIQDTKPIYINVPTHTFSGQQPSQQNNLNLFNYPQPKSTETFQTNVPEAPSISPPPLSGVSSSTLSEPQPINMEN